MRRGTTPKHTFTLPFDIPEGACVRVVYAQNHEIIVERTTESCNVSGNTVCLTLTSEETLRFDCRPHYIGGKHIPYPVEIQIGIRTDSRGKAWSEIITTDIERCLREDGVI